ncbi:MAG: alanine racemase [Caldilineales bacterium]|nr:alanine racemase [Caldilineales bacterium]
MPITLDDLLSATGATVFGPVRDAAWEDFCHDSRLAEAGQLFVALRTPTGDGHDHISEAVARGCTGILCQRPAAQHPPVTTLLVPDAGDALRAWAAYLLARRRPLVIAITGSSGKTTAKELTAELLETRFPGQVFRSRESYNDRLGAPIALGRLLPQHRLAVVELGTDAHGEIAELATLFPPTVAAITVINDAHFGAFGSLEAIAAEKTSLLAALQPGGVAILNADDPFQRPLLSSTGLPALAHSAEQAAPVRLTTDAGSPQARLWLDAAAIRSLAPALADALPPPSFTTEPGDGIILDHNLVLTPALSAPLRAAIAIAALFGVATEAIRRVVAEFQPLPGRLRPLPGVHGSTLLDDTYSANPAATGAALQALAAFSPPRLAVLGEHSGLGNTADSRLRQLGPAIAAAADYLITVGPQAQALAEGARAAGLEADRLLQADTPLAAADLARSLIGQGGTVLLKASREARLERCVAALLAEPAASPAVLARQNPAWQHLRLRNTLRPTWVEIDTQALAANLAAARQLLQPGVRLIAVLKADAYGHGAATVGRVVMRAGADMLAVACLSEALALRRAGIEAPILVLGYTPPWQARTALELDPRELHLTVYDADVAAALNQAGLAMGRQARVQVKVDTGMGRLGLTPHQAPAFLRFLRQLVGLEVAGLFTHMAAADDPTEPHTDVQLAHFDELLARLDGDGLRPPLVHAANTATLLTRPLAQYDAVRMGIGLYGLAPSPALPLPDGFRPVLAWRTTIAQVKALPPGSPVGYGLTHRTAGAATIAIIPVGYADGFRRGPANWGHVLVHGQRAPLVGRVSMDQAAIDVTHIPGVRAGDEVTLIGCQGEQCLSADEAAARLGTIGYEVVSTILARVPRLAE